MQTPQDLKVVLADSFVFAMKAQNFHWNVEGRDFVQLHELFGNIYNDVSGSIDTTAEHIRACNEYSPGSLARMLALTTIQEQAAIPSATMMVRELLSDNETVIATIRKAVETAKRDNLEEIVNYLGGRLESHTKHSWMLRASTKTDRE